MSNKNEWCYYSGMPSPNAYNKTKNMTEEEVVEMLVHFAEMHPDMLNEHMEDDDCGKGAFTEFVKDYIYGDTYE